MPQQMDLNVHPLVRFEWAMMILSLLLCAVGLSLIFSATSPMGDAGKTLVIKQITWCSFGLVLTAVFLFFDYRILERHATLFYVTILIILVSVWGLGKVTAGSRRWIEVGFMRFQPSEFAKIAVVVMLAKHLEGYVGRGGLEPIETLKPLALALLPAGLILLQPDLGTAGMVCLTSISMVLFVGVSRKTLMWFGGLVLGCAPVLYLFKDRVLHPYQRSRLLTYWNPEFDPLGAGYHIMQSQIAVGSGGLFGKGYMAGTQNQLMFLPVKHTDFIFSILAEEFGFIGCVTVLAFFTALLLRGLTISVKARDNFGVLVAFGCVAMLFWHVMVNIGMALGLLPVVGVPLTFLSYGGSSLLASFFAVAIIINVSMRRFSY